MMTTAKPDIRKGKTFNPIWIIPLLALVLGAYMIVHTWMTKGPEITVAFDTAEGLTAGKTKVKYRNVDMGIVDEVVLTDDFKGVIAKIKLQPQTRALLREDTRFWLVTARIGIGNISGLDTLLSGAYLQLAPGQGEKGKRAFTALEMPPLTPLDAPGLRLQLYTDKAGSVSTGDSVIYKGYKVGRVESTRFDPDRRQVGYDIFIDAPYHEMIDSSVRFYNVSGISVKAGADGLQLSTGSMDTILLGGVTFGTPKGMPAGEPVQNNTEFKLYASKDLAESQPFKHRLSLVVRFADSLKGLKPGAPVEYRGITIGKVDRLMIREIVAENSKDGFEGKGEAIPVLIHVEPGRIELPDTAESVEAFRKSLSDSVGKGLRATLETGNLLTGAKYVYLDRFDGEPAAEIGSFAGYLTIPTVSGGIEQVLVKVNTLLDKFNVLPLDVTVENTNSAIEQLDRTLAGLRVILEEDSTKALPGELDATLKELRKTLDGFSPGSQMYQSLNNTLQQLNRTMGNVESLTRTLANQPNAAIMPSTPSPDPIPEARR
ncbi:MAG: intermembrane transport protein PqiB [Halioglobus sp.]